MAGASATESSVLGEQHEPDGVEKLSDKAGVDGTIAFPLPLDLSMTLQQLHLPPRRQLHGFRSCATVVT